MCKGQERLTSRVTSGFAGSKTLQLHVSTPIKMAMVKHPIHIAHSPDSDDAFMFYALAEKKITSPKYEFMIESQDIEVLNRAALTEKYDITALSVHAYAYLHDKYFITASGASMAEKDYGPVVVAKKNYEKKDWSNITIAIPGEWTTAFLVLKLIVSNMRYRVLPFEKIIPAIQNGEVDAGLLIHEGQLEYKQLGFSPIISLIDFWQKTAGDLPLPLGINAIKKSLGTEIATELQALQKQSIIYAKEHARDARSYAQKFKPDLTDAQLEKYLDWYVSDRTVDFGEKGRQAMDFLFNLAFEKGLIPKKIELEIIT